MAKKNSSYWKERMSALEEVQYQRGAAYYKDVQEQYRQAVNNLQMDIERWYWRLADNNGVSYTGAKRLLKKNELEEFHWNVEQYIRAGKENAVDQRWMKELENASARYHISMLEAMKLQMQQHAELLATEMEGGMTEFLRKSYGEQYYHTAYEITKGTGVGSNLTKLDDRKVDILLKKPWAQDGKNFSDRIWTNKEKLVNNLHTELTQQIIRGTEPRKAIESLAKTMNVSKSQAGNLIMTESAAVSSRAQQECFKELGVEEFEVIETLDGKTCEICQEMDGKHFPMSDFIVGGTAPPFHPRCRGCAAPHFKDEFSEGGKRASRDLETGKTMYVPADLSYKEWKRSFVDESIKFDVDKTSEENYNNIRTKEELQSVTQNVRKNISEYTDQKSKWSGKINVDNSLIENYAFGQKEWNCDITLIDSADDGIIWHEMLHSCSVSHYDCEIYNSNKWIEEVSVEFLKIQICKEKKIVSRSAYKELTDVLQVLNDKFCFDTDMGFAKKLFNVPLPKRYDWLEELVDDRLRAENVSFEDYNEVMAFVGILKGGDSV